MKNLTKFTATLLDMCIHEDGGFSYNPSADRLNPLSGFFVSLQGYEVKTFLYDFTPDTILKYFEDHKEILLQNPSLFIGGWLHGDQVYLDVSEEFEDMNAAIAAGIERKQLSVYDAKNDASIELATLK